MLITYSYVMGRKPISITIDETILKKWNQYCENNDINKSKRIERYMKQDLSQE